MISPFPINGYPSEKLVLVQNRHKQTNTPASYKIFLLNQLNSHWGRIQAWTHEITHVCVFSNSIFEVSALPGNTAYKLCDHTSKTWHIKNKNKNRKTKKRLLVGLH